MENPSYDAAEQYVIEQIDDELRDEIVHVGTEITVSGLEDYDCIPIQMKDCRGRGWSLVSAIKVWHIASYEITVTYRSWC